MKKGPVFFDRPFVFLARPAGFEPTTPWFVGFSTVSIDTDSTNFPTIHLWGAGQDNAPLRLHDTHVEPAQTPARALRLGYKFHCPTARIPGKHFFSPFFPGNVVHF
jgi:hypothetical protein